LTSHVLCWQTLICLAVGLGRFYSFSPRKHCPGPPCSRPWVTWLPSAFSRRRTILPLRSSLAPAFNPIAVRGHTISTEADSRRWAKSCFTSVSNLVFTCLFRIQVMASRFRRYILRLMWLIRATALNTGLTYFG
jgi:hypothetical protein